MARERAGSRTAPAVITEEPARHAKEEMPAGGVPEPAAAEITKLPASSGDSELVLPEGMAPLPSWMEACGFNLARVTSSGHPQALELLNPAGVLAITVGERFVQWNGLNIALGFTPVLEDGYIALHALDVEKTVFPLAARRLVMNGGQRVLVVDPGHGGGNTGAKVHGREIWEKDLTLDWALRIERLLADSDWEVVLTRRNDRELSLPERVAIADAHRGDLFISLHFNSSGSGAQGLETFCLTPAGLPSNLTRGYEDDTEKAFPNNEYDLENLLLAARMQSSLVNATARRDRGVKRARFMGVLRDQRRPAVLIEGGFLSNPEEAALILQPEFREQLAIAVCEGLPE